MIAGNSNIAVHIRLEHDALVNVDPTLTQEPPEAFFEFGEGGAVLDTQRLSGCKSVRAIGRRPCCRGDRDSARGGATSNARFQRQIKPLVEGARKG
jgi:hypothetical protein